MDEQDKSQVLKEKIGKLFGLLLKKPVLSQETREEMEELLRGIGLDISIDDLAVIVDNIEETMKELIDRVPYLSTDQSDALSSDIDDLFSELAKDLDGTNDVADYFENKCREIQQKIVTSKFTFALKKIPKATLEMEDENQIKEIVKAAIDDIFGSVIKMMSSDDKLRLDINIEKATEENIRRFIG